MRPLFIYIAYMYVCVACMYCSPKMFYGMIDDGLSENASENVDYFIPSDGFPSSTRAYRFIFNSLCKVVGG